MTSIPRTTRHRTYTLGAAVAAATLLAAPGSAFAVSGTLDKPCYSHFPTQGSEPITVTLSGGTPGAGYVVSATVPGKGAGSAGSASGNFDATGNATAVISDVFPPSGTIGPTKGQAIGISAQDFGVPGSVDTPIGQTLITNLTMNVSGHPTSPRAHRQISVSGTPFANQKVYGFVTHGSSTHVLRRISLGTGNVCGFVSTKGIVAPKTFKPGTYRLYINAGSKLDKALALESGFRITHHTF
jgi:hypothetical protein